MRRNFYTPLPLGCGELSSKVGKSLKGQYGLEQAHREWHLLLVTWLVDKIGMEQCKAEPCVFRQVVENGVDVHIDDITSIILSGEQGLRDELFDQLKQHFPVKNLGKLKMYTMVALSSVTGTTESWR